MSAAIAVRPARPLNSLDLCDRCGAPAFVRVVMPGGSELLFCAHHNRKHTEVLAKTAEAIYDEHGNPYTGQAFRAAVQPGASA